VKKCENLEFIPPEGRRARARVKKYFIFLKTCPQVTPGANQFAINLFSFIFFVYFLFNFFLGSDLWVQK